MLRGPLLAGVYYYLTETTEVSSHFPDQGDIVQRY